MCAKRRSRARSPLRPGWKLRGSRCYLVQFWAVLWEHFIQQIYSFIFVINPLFIFYPTQLEREKIKLKRESGRFWKIRTLSGRVGVSVIIRGSTVQHVGSYSHTCLNQWPLFAVKYWPWDTKLVAADHVRQVAPFQSVFQHRICRGGGGGGGDFEWLL